MWCSKTPQQDQMTVELITAGQACLNNVLSIWLLLKSCCATNQRIIIPGQQHFSSTWLHDVLTVKLWFRPYMLNKWPYDFSVNQNQILIKTSQYNTASYIFYTHSHFKLTSVLDWKQKKTFECSLILMSHSPTIAWLQFPKTCVEYVSPPYFWYPISNFEIV